ncbi:[NiFe]-hydrogenase assembly chaperone HybE [Halomonas piscis]|uniref:[NiFe]-hydrogenase assembly chaperone HybE n=1 Tax=Halomonas piscis TaxID=3031727 RepID=UPI00289A5600|nr:[NiFe]-hydrogenase assembly chaperone HybE [Halomonas piscis]
MHTATPSGDDYAMLAAVAREYRDVHLVALKGLAHYNPRLGVDALCFQRLTPEGGEALLAGALITPCSLWLVALWPDEPADAATDEYLLTLPSGSYRLHRHAFGSRSWYQRRILDDLSELDSMEEAARLAQQLMTRLFEPPTPPKDDA